MEITVKSDNNVGYILLLWEQAAHDKWQGTRAPFSERQCLSMDSFCKGTCCEEQPAWAVSLREVCCVACWKGLIAFLSLFGFFWWGVMYLNQTKDSKYNMRWARIFWIADILSLYIIKHYQKKYVLLTASLPFYGPAPGLQITQKILHIFEFHSKLVFTGIYICKNNSRKIEEKKATWYKKIVQNKPFCLVLCSAVKYKMTSCKQNPHTQHACLSLLIPGCQEK